jgi:hypothetical protein
VNRYILRNSLSSAQTAPFHFGSIVDFCGQLSVSGKNHPKNLVFIDKFCCNPDLLLLFRNKSGIILYRHILVLHKQLQSQSPKGGEKHHEQI